MTEKLLIYWFPLVVVAGFAASLIGKTRGRSIAILAALYWIMLSATSTQGGVWNDPVILLLLIAGASIIIWVGFWMGSPQSTGAKEKPGTDDQATTTANDEWGHDGLIADLASRFDDWLETNRHKSDPWPDFGEFMRSALYLGAGAKHLRVYRVVDGGNELLPLRLTDPGEASFPPLRNGIIGHVVTSGKSYYANDPKQGELVDRLANQEEEPCVWCFPIRYQSRTVGVIRAGEIPSAQHVSIGWLKALEALISLCWSTMAESCLGRLAGHIDPVAGVMTHEAFSIAADSAAREAYRRGEPVVVAHISIGGVRNLYDRGDWSTANKVIAASSQSLRERLRHDDEIGVYEASQFFLLLRRVDTELATLIVEQLVERVDEICTDQDRWGTTLSVCCGVAGSGIEAPPVGDLLIKAMNNSHRARSQSVQIVSDLNDFAEAKA